MLIQCGTENGGRSSGKCARVEFAGPRDHATICISAGSTANRPLRLGFKQTG